jgi:hypothetical protein
LGWESSLQSRVWIHKQIIWSCKPPYQINIHSPWWPKGQSCLHHIIMWWHKHVRTTINLGNENCISLGFILEISHYLIGWVLSPPRRSLCIFLTHLHWFWVKIWIFSP